LALSGALAEFKFPFWDDQHHIKLLKYAEKDEMQYLIKMGHLGPR
jgi:hypothetical protein